MRETEFWERMQQHLGAAYASVWAGQHNLSALGNRTVDQALADGVPPKTIWRAVWAALELPDRER
ncbi:hypothetical protein FHX74_003065 [Friedmanniella endophytica]|uniref:DUF3046 domain-containing protein n=1 Tax=Microlunatus kandeliicorticis TaxID=1759536 RepID=A0A7W3IUH6_9ACTN|nr:DUF3046 domain-containing protein [Microlunatus kandeliicorticis]MBA8795429.1 hypothetical protein [Microlunatus kandeliicorticis]